MNTKYLILAAALITFPISVIYASDTGRMDKMTPDMSMKGDMKMMGNMHKQMQKMMQQMNEIHNTKAPEKRDLLIEEHMKSMQEGMKLMGSGMMGGMKDKSNMNTNMKMSKDDMHKRINMMENRMDMMQGMMGQMMNHSMEKTKTTKIRNRRHK